MDNKLNLRLVNDSDIEQFKIWLHKDHVSKWYHDTDDWLKEINERNGAFGFLNHFIVTKGDEPIGFCQYYDCFDAKELWYSVERRGKIFSIDYLIGEENYLRKGFGKQIIKLLIDEISKKHENFEIIVQPDTENIASNKTLLANRFIYDENKQYYVIKIQNNHTKNKFMAQHNCENCLIRAKYDKAPKSLIGRFWRWHITFCPGWKKYMNALDDEKRKMLKEKYNLK